MKAISVLGALAVACSVEAVVVPHCKHCKQDACMDAVIKSECKDYLVIVETPATETVVVSATATVVPTEVSLFTYSTTVINDVTETIAIIATSTVDYTLTVEQPATATDTVKTSVTVTLQPTSPVKRSAGIPNFSLPPYASACTDIAQYSSACACIGAGPVTSTVSAPQTISTVTTTVTPSAAIEVSTVETVAVTEVGSTIPFTTTVSTAVVSSAIGTVAEEAIVATTTVTETEAFTVTPTPTVCVPGSSSVPLARLSVDDGAMQLENINVPPGAHIGVIATVRATTNPATIKVDCDGSVTYYQNPPIHVPYSFYYYTSSAGYSYVQVTSELVAGIMGVRRMDCATNSAGELSCLHNGVAGELYLCGRHLAFVFNTGTAAAFQGTCATPIIRVVPKAVTV